MTDIHSNSRQPSSQTAVTQQRDDPPESDDVLSGAELLELLGDEYTYQILTEIVAEPKRAREIVAATGMSRPTVYRRLDELERAGLASPEMCFDADGHHCKRYGTTVGRICMEFSPDGIDVDVESSVHD